MLGEGDGEKYSDDRNRCCQQRQLQPISTFLEPLHTLAKIADCLFKLPKFFAVLSRTHNSLPQ